MATQHAAEAGAHASSGGMPQLDFSTFPSQIFWLIVAMIALYYVMSRVALPRIAGAIEERHDAIEDDLERAAEFKRRAELAEDAYQQALTDARRKSADIAQEARAEIQKELDAAMAQADAKIAEKTAESEKHIGELRARADGDVKSVAEDIAAALAEALAPGQVSAAEAQAAVNRRLQG